ncbi:MAG: hypothetical protein J1F20_02080 [Muribaculaceae bacterium]|nr:hypothetical protein [Muribaculaceae bacterium]
MKKLIILATVFVSLALTSCSKSPADYANEMVKLEKEMMDYRNHNEFEKMRDVQEKMLPLLREIGEQSKANPDFMSEYNTAYKKAKRAK